MTPVEKLFANLPRLPSMPKIVQDLVASLCKDDVDIASLARQVKQDQSLSARVLQMANSAAFGSSKPIGAIDQAVTMIGLSAFRSLVIASGMSRTFTKIEGFDMRGFWKHSLVSAGVAKVFGKREGVDPEVAYTAALMHRLGQLLIHMAYPMVARQLSREGAGAQAGESGILTVEHSLIQTDHCEVGAELAKRWNFPAEIQNALRYYLDPLNPAAGPLAAVVAIAEQVARGLEHGLSAQAIDDALDANLLTRLRLEREDALWRIENCKDLVLAAEQML